MRTKKPRCPICDSKDMAYPAVSRYDDKTLVCPDCGLVESLNMQTVLTCAHLHCDFDAYAHVMAKHRNDPLVKAIRTASRKAMRLWEKQLRAQK